jgi:hypothetical protein
MFNDEYELRAYFADKLRELHGVRAFDAGRLREYHGDSRGGTHSFADPGGPSCTFGEDASSAT